jgi:hypothetical protein
MRVSRRRLVSVDLARNNSLDLTVFRLSAGGIGFEGIWGTGLCWWLGSGRGRCRGMGGWDYLALVGV